jgi:general stress protein 26
MTNLIKSAKKLLVDGTTCAVSSITENGHPRVCFLIAIKNDGIKTVYFATGTSSKKAKHYKQNPKAGVSFYKGNDSVTLVGSMEILSDKQEKNALWQDWMAQHFPNGGKDDPEYTVIKFTAVEGTFWIDGNFDTLKV